MRWEAEAFPLANPALSAYRGSCLAGWQAQRRGGGTDCFSVHSYFLHLFGPGQQARG